MMMDIDDLNITMTSFPIWKSWISVESGSGLFPGSTVFRLEYRPKLGTILHISKTMSVHESKEVNDIMAQLIANWWDFILCKVFCVQLDYMLKVNQISNTDTMTALVSRFYTTLNQLLLKKQSYKKPLHNYSNQFSLNPNLKWRGIFVSLNL